MQWSKLLNNMCMEKGSQVNMLSNVLLPSCPFFWWFRSVVALTIGLFNELPWIIGVCNEALIWLDVVFHGTSQLLTTQCRMFLLKGKNAWAVPLFSDIQRNLCILVNNPYTSTPTCIYVHMYILIAVWLNDYYLVGVSLWYYICNEQGLT